jgi:putative ABC transport system permease protein
MTSIATVFVFGLLPAWQVSRASLAEVLKEGGRGTGSAQHGRLQGGLVVLQVAVALVLLTGAGLLSKSFAHFLRLDLGFRPEGVLTAQIALTPERYPTAAAANVFFRRVAEELAAQPGIEAASVSANLPGGTAFNLPAFTIVGDPVPDPAHAPTAVRMQVGPEYFRTMGILLRRGRGLLRTDDGRAVKVVVIDELLARRFFGGRDPIGQRLALGMGWATDTAEIVGVVASAKNRGLTAEDAPAYYVPFAQVLQLLGNTWVKDGVGASIAIRTVGDPAGNARLVKQVMARLDPLVPVYHFETMTERVVQSVGTTRFASVLASLFAAIALILGMVGIYSVLASIVAQRRRETAVRLALGASRSRVMGDVLRRALTLAGIGTAVGSLGAWILTRLLSGLFLAVNPHDPVIFVGAAVVFVILALAAATGPAYRTTRINPATALTSP